VGGFKGACRQVVSNPAVDVRRMVGIGITHQRFTFVPVDKNMKPLRRASCGTISLLQGSGDARQKVGKELIFERTGYPPGQWTLYKALWLKEHRNRS